MRKIVADRSRARNGRILKRLDRFNYPDDMSKPMLQAPNVGFELAGRVTDQPFQWKVDGKTATLKAPPLPVDVAEPGSAVAMASALEYRLQVR